MKKVFTISHLKVLLNQLQAEEISFSRFVEILNQTSHTENEAAIIKAEKWEKLGDKISEFYQYDEDDDYSDDDMGGLDGIGEVAAMAFGYL